MISTRLHVCRGLPLESAISGAPGQFELTLCYKPDVPARMRRCPDLKRVVKAATGAGWSML
jgi:hypothetical protein